MSAATRIVTSADGVVGRHAELSLVSALLESVPVDPGGCLMEGPAGVGKSTVWSAGIAQARDRGFRVLSCRPSAAEAHLSFAAVADLLDTELAEALPHLPGPQRRGLETALLRADAEDAADERAVAFGFLTALRALSRSGPVLVAVDDWQWLDTPSERVLRFALRRLSDEPVGLLAAIRTEGPLAGPSINAEGPLAGPSINAEGPLAGQDVGADLERTFGDTRFTRLRLAPLSLAAQHQVLAARADMSFPRHILLKIQNAAAGNMIFAIEIARLLAARTEPLPPGVPLPIPATFNELVAQRMADLPATACDTLRAAAALGQPTTGLLHRVADHPPAEALALCADLVTVDDERVRFRHPLIAAAVYATATGEHRRALHEHLARVVTEPEEHARHLALATAGPSATVAAALDQAAAAARTRGAPDAAAELCELAAGATPPDDPGSRRRRAAAAADHHVLAGDRYEARRLLEEVLATCPPGLERARVLRVLGEVRYYDDSFPEADRLLRSALAEVGDDPAERATILCSLGYVAHALERMPESAALARAAVTAAEQAGTRGLLAEALAEATISEFLLGRGLNEEFLLRAIALEDVTRRVPTQNRPSAIRAVLMSWVGRPAESQDSLRSLRARLLDLGDDAAVPLLAFVAAPEACFRGDLAAAERHAREGLDTATRLGSDVQLAYARTATAYAHAYRGRTDAALRDAEHAVALFDRVGCGGWSAWPLSVLGFTHLSRDDPDTAAQVLRPFLSGLPDRDVQEPTGIPFVAYSIEALILLGDLSGAEPLLDWFEHRSGAVGRVGTQAAAAHCRGLWHAAHGDLTSAQDAVAEALALHENLEQPVEQARILLTRGRLQRRANQRRTARDTFEQARRIFVEIGAHQWLRCADAELNRLGLHRPAGPEVTPRELQVAEHAATGRTNNQIAAALSISPKTVEANLARVYRKLGINSRAELGAWMATRNPTT